MPTRYTEKAQTSITALPSEGNEPNDGMGRRGSEQEEVRVQQSVYIKYIKSQIEDEEACLELPLTIILLISFSLLAVLHLKQDVVFSVEQGIERDVLENANFAFSHYFGHKGIFDAHSVADFWSWVRLGFIPLVIQPTWSYSEHYSEDAKQLFNSSAAPRDHHIIGGNPRPLPITGDYLHYNRIIGGLRFRQEVVQVSEESCKFPGAAGRDVWMQWYGKPCMAATTELAFMPDTPTAEDFGDAQRVEWMFADLDSLETMLAQAVDMEDGCSQMASKNRTCLCKWCQEQNPHLPWLTESTQRVEIQMATYNAEYGLISLTGVNFFFNRGGFIHKRVEIMSSWMDIWSMPWSALLPMLFFDAVWVTSLMYITVSEVREIVNTIRHGEGRWYITLKDDYIAFWNVVDWVSILVAIMVVIFFAMLLQNTSRMHEAFSRLIDVMPSAGAVDRDTYAAAVIKFYQALEDVCSWEKVFRMSLCIYPMMVMLRLFKSFAAQPRLAMVTETMKYAYQDMLHFSLVFTGVTVCLCLNAVLLFGQDHQEFATFARALHSCFRMMYGDWEWKPMEQVWRLTAMLWFWLFMTLLVVILLNMLLAIIMDNYMNVKKTSAGAVTLGGQLQSMWRRYKQNKRRERVRLNEILKWFLDDADGSVKEAMSSEREVNPSFLMDNIRGIPLDQALRTIKNAITEHEKQTEDEFKLEDIVEPLNHISVNTARSRDGLYYAYDRVDYYDSGAGDEQQPEEEAEVFTDGGKLLGADSRAVSEEVLAFVHSQVQRLSAETARILAQSVRSLDQRQGRIEQRQADMAASVREVQAALLNLQSAASSSAHRLQRLCHEQARSGQQASAWRKGLYGCGMVPACLDVSTADATEAVLPGMQRSAFGNTLKAG